MKTKIILAALIVLQSAAWAAAASEDIEYYAVFIEGAKAGFATHSRTVASGRVTTTDIAEMTISRMGIQLNIKTKETCVETVDGEPISFSSEQNMGLGMTTTTGTIGRDGIVRIQNSEAGSQQTPPGQGNSFAWPKDAVMAEGLRLLEIKNGMKEGASYSVKIFSPSLLNAVDSRVLVGGKQDVDLLGRIVKLTKVSTVMSMPGTGEMTTDSYVDEELNALKSVTPMADMKMEMVACTKEVALGSYEPVEIIDKMFMASPEPIEDVGSAKSITYYLKPTSQAGSFIIPSSDNQRVQQQEDGTVKVTISPVSAPAGARFPYKGPDRAILDATMPSRFLQSNDAKIIELTKRAVGDTKDAAEAARRIESFVASYVKNISLSVGYASATEVAASRRGDCTEFSVLCAAMCRSAGIPARVAMGVAYVDDFEGRDGFGGHAWVEAYIGGKWVGLDSTFKASERGGYDAGHIAFAMGDGEPASFFNLATTLGRFKIEKITVER
jgi:hypothetical protein